MVPGQVKISELAFPEEPGGEARDEIGTGDRGSCRCHGEDSQSPVPSEGPVPGWSDATPGSSSF